MSQKTLERVIWGSIGSFVLGAFLLSDVLRNVLFLLVLLAIFAVLPFWVDSLVRYKFIPFIDSLNTGPDRHEDLKVLLRILIWGFLGVVMALSWWYIVSIVFGLNLWFGRILMAIGCKSLAMTHEVWQWGWFLVFLLQFLILFFGWIYDIGTDDRSNYPA